MKQTRDSKTNAATVPAFVIRAESAMRRAAKNVRIQNRKLNLPLIVWENGKMVEKPA